MRRAPVRDIELGRRVSEGEDVAQVAMGAKASRLSLVFALPKNPREGTAVLLMTTGQLAVYRGAKQGWAMFSPDA